MYGSTQWVRRARAGVVAAAMLVVLAFGARPGRATPPAPTGATIPLGADAGAAASDPGLRSLYFASVGSGQVVLVDAATGTKGPVASVPNALALAVDPVAHVVWVGQYNTQLVTPVEGVNGVAGEAVVVDASNIAVSGVAVDPALHKLYVTGFGSGRVYVVDTVDKFTTAFIPVGANPQGIAVDPTTHRVYVNNRGSDTVKLIDGNTNSVLSTITVGSRPGELALDAGASTLYVGNASSNTISVIDTKTFTVARTIPLPDTPSLMSVDPVSHALYVSTPSRVVVIEGGSASSIGISSPGGVAFDAPSRSTYIARAGGKSDVQVFGPKPSLTAVSSSANPVVGGQPVTFTATVTPGTGGGTVQFLSDGNTIPGCGAAPVLFANGKQAATCTSSALPVGTHAIAASYSGSAGTLASGGSLPNPQQVTAPPPGSPPITAPPPAPGTTLPGPEPAGAPTTLVSPIPGSPPTTADPTSATDSTGSSIAPRDAGSAAGRNRLPAPRPSDVLPTTPDPPVADAFVESVPAPAAVFDDLPTLARNAVFGVLVLGLLCVPLAIVNATAEEHADELESFTGRVVRRLRLPGVGTRLRAAPPALALGAAALAGGILYGLARPGFGLDRSSVALAAGIAVGGFVVNGVSRLAQARAIRSGAGLATKVRLYPGFFVLALCCAALTRALGMRPGLVLLPLAALVAGAELPDPVEGRSVAVRFAVVAAFATVAWVGRATVLGHLGRGPGLVHDTVAAMLTTITVAGVEELLTGSLPLRRLDGLTLLRWSRAGWAAFATAGAIGFVVIVVHPVGGQQGAAPGTRSALTLLGTYLVLAAAFSTVFQLRSVRAASAGVTR